MSINWNFLDKVHWADVSATLALLGVMFASVVYIYIKDQKRNDEKYVDISKKIDDKETSTKNYVKDIMDNSVEKIKLIYQHQETLYNINHKQNEETHNLLLNGLKEVSGSLDKVKEQLKEYSIINHDAFDHELQEISLSHKLCSLDVINRLIEQNLAVKNKGQNNHEDFLNSLRIFVGEEQKKKQAALIMKGVSLRTMEIWEETEHETFPVYENWISSKYQKLQTLKGNGSLDRLIYDTWMDFAREMSDDFMKRIVKKLTLKKDPDPIDPVNWNDAIKYGSVDDWAKS